MIKCIPVSLLGIFFVLSGCQRDGFNVALPNKETTLTDVSYGDDSFQKMDVYLPANRAPKTKIIVYLHGGSWITGDKSEAKEVAGYFQKKGYAFISMNYRLTGTENNYINPAQLQDIGKALDFINNQSEQWIITGNRICLFGGSAGGNLSLLYAYKNTEDKRVKAVISVSGPVDLTDPEIMNTTFRDLIQVFVGSKLSDNKEAWLGGSPSHYICETSTPTLFFQGKQDNLVPYHQVVLAYNKLLEFGVNTKLVLYNDGTHGLAEQDHQKILSEMEDFVNTTYP